MPHVSTYLKCVNSWNLLSRPLVYAVRHSCVAAHNIMESPPLSVQCCACNVGDPCQKSSSCSSPVFQWLWEWLFAVLFSTPDSWSGPETHLGPHTSSAQLRPHPTARRWAVGPGDLPGHHWAQHSLGHLRRGPTCPGPKMQISRVHQALYVASALQTCSACVVCKQLNQAGMYYSFSHCCFPPANLK